MDRLELRRIVKQHVAPGSWCREPHAYVPIAGYALPLLTTHLPPTQLPTVS
ncbi:hypothetical protein OK074_0369 [Actinobacteria bacterium OK074]|nr:hypothetical protein OK074_0369 [Actinobacteria bacterium OK074]